MSRVIETEIVYAEKSPCKTADEMEDVCCHAHAELPCCTKVEYWDGPSQEDGLKALGIELDDKGRNAAGEYVEIVFGPRDKPCGLKETVYDTSPGNCCDQVADIVYDDENSVDVLADNSNGYVFWSGGRAPFTVTLKGVGFFSEGEKQLITSNRFLSVETTDACGTCNIIIEDGCSTEHGQILSTSGQYNNCHLYFAYYSKGTALFPSYTELTSESCALSPAEQYPGWFGDSAFVISSCLTYDTVGGVGLWRYKGNWGENLYGDFVFSSFASDMSKLVVDYKEEQVAEGETAPFPTTPPRIGSISCGGELCTYDCE